MVFACEDPDILYVNPVPPVPPVPGDTVTVYVLAVHCAQNVLADATATFPAI